MVKVPDALSLAAMHYLAQRLGRRVGGSSGTNLIGALMAAQQMAAAGVPEQDARWYHTTGRHLTRVSAREADLILIIRHKVRCARR